MGRGGVSEAADAAKLRELATVETDAAELASILRWAQPDERAALGASPLQVTNPLAWLYADDAGRAQPLPIHVEPPPRSNAYVTTSPEIIKAVEQAGPRRVLQVSPTPLVWELERVRVPFGTVLVLQRIATYLAATPPGGAPIVTLGDTDPYLTFDDPAGALQVRWLLGYVQGDDRSAGGPLVAAPTSAAIPMTAVDGAPLAWRDQRYAWGARFCDGRQRLIFGPAVVRLFVEAASAAAWSVAASGVLGGFMQAAGPEGRASIAATVPI